MARPAGWKPYTTADGATVPSVSTICSRFKDSGGLLFWAWSEGAAGRDFRQTRDAAAESGTLAHAAVEAWIHKRPFEFTGEPDVRAKAETAFEAFLAWAEMTQLQVTDTEVRMVSEVHRFGGTADAFTVRGRRAVLDWKSSSGIYPEYVVQVAAYGLLWNELHPSDPITGGYHLVRFDKQHGDFHHHYWAEANDAARMFLLLREAYDLDKALKARVR